jgi:hypothetical protein
LLSRSTQTDGIEVVRFNPAWVGVVGAVWAAVAERIGKELCDLQSFFGGPEVQLYPDNFRLVFHTSIRERQGSAFSARTRAILDSLWKRQEDEKLAILLSTSCVPDHAWNADTLAEFLLRLPADDLQSNWSTEFGECREELMEQANEIIDWACTVNTKSADTEVMRLASLTLTCLLMADNSRIRDPATKRLANLLVGTPMLYSNLRNRFRAIEDLDFQARLLALSPAL